MEVLVRERDEFHAALAAFQRVFQSGGLRRSDDGITLLLPHAQ